MPTGGRGASRASQDDERARRDAENERKEIVAAWEAVVREREEISRSWIDRERFYNRLSVEETIAANERVLAYLKEYLDDVENLHVATEEERLQIRRNINSLIERYERQHHTAMRELAQEGEVDEARAAQRRQDALQRDIDRAESDIESYRAYSALREALQEQLYKTLDEISSRFWLSEREKLHASEDAHREYTMKIEQIEQKMQNLRLRNLQEQATQWRAFQTEHLDVMRRELDEQHRVRRDALNRELEQLRDHFAALDAEERRWERGRNLQELLEEENVWANAATHSGQERLRNIRRQIEDLQRQEERESRTVARQEAETNIRSQISALDADHKRQIEELDQQREALKEKYELMKEAAGQLAKDTRLGLNEAGEALSDGLLNMYEEFDDTIDKLTQNQLMKTKIMALEMQHIFKQLQATFSSMNFSIGGGGGSVTNNDNSRNMTLQSTNNFYGNDQRGMSQAWHEQTDIALRHLRLRV
jgi:hypothetical protein